MTEAYKSRKEKIFNYYEEQIRLVENELADQKRIWNKKLQLMTDELNELKEEFAGFIKEQEILNNNTK